MPDPMPYIQFSTDTPAAPTGQQNVVFQTDGATPMASFSAFVPVFVGDAGAGGESGGVPAPAAGDAASGKYLKADGSWSAPTVASGFTSGSGSSGYWVKDPVGHIRQWGTINADINSGTVTVFWPTAFSNAGSISVVVATRSGSDRITFVIDGSVTTSGFEVSNNGSAGYADWIADGY